MRNYQKNATMNHSYAMESLGSVYYDKQFVNGAIGTMNNDAIIQCLATGKDEMGGYLVPDSMEKQIVHALAENNVIRRLATVIHTEGWDYRIPLLASMSDAQWLSENYALPMAKATFDNRVLKAHKLDMMVQVCEDLVKDAGVDMKAFLSEAFAEQIASAEEDAFINGDGAYKPLGLLANNSAETGVVAHESSALTAEEIITLYYALDEKYRQNAVFMMHEDTAKALRLLKDENGHYLWREALGGEPDRLLGRPVYLSRFMPKMAAGAKPVLFGDLSKYWIGDRGNRSLCRFDELFAEQGQIGYRMTEYVDGKLILHESVKVIQMAE